MAFTHDLDADHTITLTDGRTLGYSEFGDPDGFPILNNHGGLMCRFDVEFAHEDAQRRGARIISPDRPGVATSDYLADRDTLAWVDDIGELLAALGVDEFVNMGWSMGGQYALAVAHRFAPRVRATAVIAGCLPLDEEATFAELNSMDQKLTNLAQNHPKVARTEFGAIGKLEHRFPERMTKFNSRSWPEADRDATFSETGWMAATMVEAMGQTDGMVEEYRAWVRPWRFALNDLRGPVAIWQGAEDPLVPPAWGRQMAEAIPDAELHEIESAGHMIAVSHRSEIMGALLEHRG